jgi:Holliday junction DNA helicase RuvB
MSDQKNEINDVAPSSIRHLIGQRGVIDQVAVALDAAQMDGKKLEHSLLLGPPGLGKSALAAVLAREMATEFHEVLGQAIASPADLHALLLTAKNRDVVHIDEAHELGKPFQTALYLALDKRKIVLGGSKGNAPQNLPLADFTVLLSTTDEYNLLQPLRDRMRLVLRFDYYSPRDLVTLLEQRAKALGWEIHDELLPLIAQRSRGTPRLALRLLQSCRRVCRSQGESVITFGHLTRACELEQIDFLGLGPMEQKYLQILANGNSRLNVIASMLGLPSRTIAEVTEPFLIRAGLLVKDDQGRRQLTAMGRKHASNDDTPEAEESES